MRNQCTSITNACLINLLFLTIFRIVILVDVRAHNCYIFKSRQPSQAMSLHLRIRAHSRHPSYKTIGDVCFDCASQIFTSVLPAHEWKLGVLMEKLCDVFMHSSKNFLKLLMEESQAWAVQFLQQLLGKKLNSLIYLFFYIFFTYA